MARLVPAAYYNGKLVLIDYIEDPKRRFRVACQRVHDNLPAGQVGYARDEQGKVYLISRESRQAKPVTNQEILDLFN